MPAVVEFVAIEISPDRVSVAPCINLNGGIYNASTHGNAQFALNMTFAYAAADGSPVSKVADVLVADTEKERVLQGNSVQITTEVALDTPVPPGGELTSTIGLSKRTDTGGDEPVEPPITDISVLA